MAGKSWGGGTAVLLSALLVNTGYVWAFGSPTLFYVSNVLLHLALGAACFAALAAAARPDRALRPAAALMGAAFAAGLYLAAAGNTLDKRAIFYAHIVVAMAAAVAAVWKLRRHTAAALAFCLLLPAAAALYRRVAPDPRDRIRNPAVPPLSMEHEGGGARSPFFPSSAQTNTGGVIPSNFFMDSQRCGECHKDIYEQWKSSMHRFASFNNQFYRKSIEYMQSVVGTKPSRWCAGCHDHAMIFNGRFDRPAKEQIDTPEAHVGLACVSCHSIVHVDSSMGNGGFTIEYPPLHDLANSKNRYMRMFHDFVTYLNPEPHRRSFMKPFMRKDASEYCSACHKVHLDVPVNQYRWVRGFNDYDNWQASGVSGQGARSFYYPPAASTCTDCHMPLVASNDPGNRNGKVHNHRFLGANTAVPFVNKDAEQLETATKFLQSGFITVDIFSASPVEDRPGDTPMMRRLGEGPQVMSSIAVGEEAEQAGQGFVREVGRVAAPLNRSGLAVRPGSHIRVDVVVRTRRMGHFFPGGTVDAFDVWLELQARDAEGKIIFWSGQIEDGGRGPVEPGAHFYRAYQLDGEGNHINKRNAWQMRSVLYARMIPPGAADTAHFRMAIPRDVKGPITLMAKLNHRKFSYYYTRFSYTDDEGNYPRNPSGQIKDRVPDLPVTVLASAETTLAVSSAEPSWRPVIRKEDRERWNDWGIGLLLQGDLKGAEYAFRRVTEADPGYADGWLNVARALIQEGETGAAKPFLARALELDNTLARIYYFKGLVEKADGDYDAALASFRTAASKYPRDRVVQNQVARILFLKREYRAALDALAKVAEVDPEDLQMHYTAMLCYRGLGMEAEASRAEKLFRRFKAEEASQALTARKRMLSPEDNNERQMIHDHVSVPGGSL